MGFLQIRDGEAGVMLEGVEGFVAEDLLDVVHVGAAAQELGGAAAAKGVRGDRNLHPRLRGVPMQESPEGVIGQPVAARCLPHGAIVNSVLAWPNEKPGSGALFW